jgi:hypothetical protein
MEKGHEFEKIGKTEDKRIGGVQDSSMKYFISGWTRLAFYQRWIFVAVFICTGTPKYENLNTNALWVYIFKKLGMLLAATLSV